VQSLKIVHFLGDSSRWRLPAFSVRSLVSFLSDPGDVGDVGDAGVWLRLRRAKSWRLFSKALADGRLELILAEERERAKEGGYMLTDQKLRIAWNAYLA
jgi:hypothetical protein